MSFPISRHCQFHVAAAEALDIPQAFWDAVADLPFETEDPEADRVYRPG